MPVGHHPTSVHALLKKATAAAHLMRTEFEERYPNPRDLPQSEWPRYRESHALNQAAFEQAEDLGWVPHPIPTTNAAQP